MNTESVGALSWCQPYFCQGQAQFWLLLPLENCVQVDFTSGAIPLELAGLCCG